MSGSNAVDGASWGDLFRLSGIDLRSHIVSSVPSDNPDLEALLQHLHGVAITWQDPASGWDAGTYTHLFAYAVHLCQADFTTIWQRLGRPRCIVLNGANADEFELPREYVSTVHFDPLSQALLLDGRPAAESPWQVAIHDGDGELLPNYHSGRLVLIDDQGRERVTNLLGFQDSHGCFIELAQSQRGDFAMAVCAGEIERRLQHQSVVRDVAALADADGLKLLVQLEVGITPDALCEVYLRDALAELMATHKIPERIHFVGQIPRDVRGLRDYQALATNDFSANWPANIDP